MNNLDDQVSRYVQFRLGDKKFALDIAFMDEVLNLQEIVEIPDAPLHVKGVTRFRTTAIPVISIKVKLGFEECEYGKKSRIIVVKYNNENIGILIDELIGILDKPVHGKQEDMKGVSNIEILELKKLLTFDL